MNRIQKIFSIVLPYYAGRVRLVISQALRISPRGEHRFEKKYWTRPFFTDRRSKAAEDRKQAELAGLAKEGIVEIGVLYGETSKILASANPAVPVYGIDPIIMDSMSDNLIGNDETIRRNTQGLSNYTLIKDFSYNVVGNWNKPFDYIYIDGSHVYEDVKKDFEDWLPKLSKGGLIAFHDSTMYRGGMPYWPGPSKLADELILDPRVEFVESYARLTVFRKR